MKYIKIDTASKIKYILLVKIEIRAGGEEMEFYNYLLDTYGYNEVIVGSDIIFKNYSRPWIAKAIANLCEEKKLIRFEKGIYYIPNETIIGISKLDPNKVITKKYLSDGKEVVGYYSGVTFMNMIGLSTQVPNTIEIFTNNEPSRVREVSIGNQKTILRRARTLINKENVATMSFLELMNFTDASFYDEEKKQIVSDFISENNITRKSIKTYSPFFPDKAMRTLVESEIIYDVA